MGVVLGGVLVDWWLVKWVGGGCMYVCLRMCVCIIYIQIYIHIYPPSPHQCTHMSLTSSSRFFASGSSKLKHAASFQRPTRRRRYSEALNTY